MVIIKILRRHLISMFVTSVAFTLWWPQAWAGINFYGIAAWTATLGFNPFVTSVLAISLQLTAHYLFTWFALLMGFLMGLAGAIFFCTSSNLFIS